MTAIDNQLRHQPGVATRNRKCLGQSLVADFEYDPPLWELRVGEYRVFYDIDDEILTVYIHAVREKPPESTTDEVL